MDMPNHIPIHPRFAAKVFMQQPHVPPAFAPQEPSMSAQDIPNSSAFGSGGVGADHDDFDIFEVPADKPIKEEPKKRPYDKMIIVMAVVIIVLIAVVVWLMLSSNDESVDDRKINPNQFAGYPPAGMRMPPQYMQMPPQFAQMNQQMPAAPQNVQVPSSAPQEPAKPDVTKAYKSEMDSLYDELKQKSANNEKLPLDKYVKKPEESKPRTLDTIFEETNSDEDVEEFTTDADEHIQSE